MKKSFYLIRICIFSGLLFLIACSEDESINQALSSGDAPVANFTTNHTNIQPGSSIVFTDLSTNDPISWQWDFGDGGSSTEQNPEHIYTLPGTYTLTLITSNSYGIDTITISDWIIVRINDIEYGSVTDYDGNIYNTVTIGTQVWMAENLEVTHYPDGTEIPLITDNAVWTNLSNNDTEDAYCYYENKSNSEYGALYTYAAAIHACPTGWHLPSDDEWTTLENFIKDNKHNVSVALKAVSGWSGSGNGTDDYGFSALPYGYRNTSIGAFYNAGDHGRWWSSTSYINTSSAYLRLLDSFSTTVYDFAEYKSTGISVRCLRD